MHQGRQRERGKREIERKRGSIERERFEMALKTARPAASLSRNMTALIFTALNTGCG